MNSVALMSTELDKPYTNNINAKMSADISNTSLKEINAEQCNHVENSENSISKASVEINSSIECNPEVNNSDTNNDDVNHNSAVPDSSDSNSIIHNTDDLKPDDNTPSTTAVCETACPDSTVDSIKLEAPEEVERGNTASEFSDDDDFLLEVVDEIADNLDSDDDEVESPSPVVANGLLTPKKEPNDSIHRDKSIDKVETTNGKNVDKSLDDEKMEEWLEMCNDDLNKSSEDVSKSSLEEKEVSLPRFVLEKEDKKETDSSESDSTDEILDRLCKEEELLNSEESCEQDDKTLLSDKVTPKESVNIESIIDIHDTEESFCGKLKSVKKKEGKDLIYDRADDNFDLDHQLEKTDLTPNHSNLEDMTKFALSVADTSEKKKGADDALVNKNDVGNSADASDLGEEKNDDFDSNDEVLIHCKAAIQSLVNLILLQHDQRVTSDRIAVMENIIQKTSASELLDIISEGSDSSEVVKESAKRTLDVSPDLSTNKKQKIASPDSSESSSLEIQFVRSSGSTTKINVKFNPKLESIMQQSYNDNSSDSDKSVGKLKFNAKVENILKSLATLEPGTEMSIDESEIDTLKKPKDSSQDGDDKKGETLLVPKSFYGEIESIVMEENLTEILTDDKDFKKMEPKPECSATENVATNGELPRTEEKEEGDVIVKVDEAEFSGFVRSKVREFTNKKYSSLIKSLDDTKEMLLKDLATLRNSTDELRIVMKDLATKQSEIFRANSHNPKIEKRTVGVNVRIVQQEPKEVKTPVQTTPVKTTISSAASKPQLTITTKTTTTNQPAKPTTPVQSNAPMQVLLTSPPSANNAIRFASSQPFTLRPAVKPASISLPITTSVVLLTSNTTTTTSSHQLVDLTDDEPPKRQITVVSTSPIKSSSVVKTQLPPKPTSAPPGIMTLPLANTLPPSVQQLPQGTTVTTVRAGAPQLPVRMAYLVQNPPGAPISQAPRILSNLRHPLQAFVIQSLPNSQNSVVTRMMTATSTTTTPPSIPALTTTTQSQLTLTPCFNQHPAPLPAPQTYVSNPNFKALPPKPVLKMNKVTNGIVLSWNMNLTTKNADVESYQLFAYQENKGPVSPHLWKKVGDIKALPLPMACTLTQFVEGHKYHFTVRAVDVHKRLGPFSDPSSILLTKGPDKPPARKS